MLLAMTIVVIIVCSMISSMLERRMKTLDEILVAVNAISIPRCSFCGKLQTSQKDNCPHCGAAYKE